MQKPSLSTNFPLPPLWVTLRIQIKQPKLYLNRKPSWCYIVFLKKNAHLETDALDEVPAWMHVSHKLKTYSNQDPAFCILFLCWYPAQFRTINRQHMPVDKSTHMHANVDPYKPKRLGLSVKPFERIRQKRTGFWWYCWVPNRCLQKIKLNY